MSVSSVLQETVHKLLTCFTMVFCVSGMPCCAFQIFFQQNLLSGTFSNISYCTFLIASNLWGSPLKAPCRAWLRVSGTKWFTTAESCQATVMLKQPLHSLPRSTSTEPGLESYQPGACDFPKASWSSNNSSLAMKQIDKDHLWVKRT